MNPLQSIKAGILQGDWTLVSKGYNGLTGENLAPSKIAMQNPVVTKQKPLTKQQAYNKLIRHGVELESMSKYKVKDLRKMLDDLPPQEEAQPVVQNVPHYGTDNGIAVVKEPPRKNDKRFAESFIAPAKFNDFKQYGDESPKITGQRPPAQKVTITCTSCKQSKQVSEMLAVERDGQLVGRCHECR